MNLLTKADLIFLSTLNIGGLRALLYEKSYNEAMRIRRNMQVAMAMYRGDIPSITQDKYLRVINRISSWCADVFFRVEISRYLRQTRLVEKMSLKDAMEYAKARLKPIWADYERRNSF